MENEIENEGGVTIGYIFRTIFSQKWLALIIAVVITLVGTLGLYFIDKRNEMYSVSFVLQLPNTGDASSTSYTYPDGESFYFTDIISKKNLEDVASKEGFEAIDVDKMVKNNDISIIRSLDKLDDKNNAGVYDLNYTVKVKAKYFADEDSARDFIEALTSFPRDHIAKMGINYDQSLTTSKSAITYDEQLTLLKNQTVYIQTKYDALIKSYGSEFVVSDGRTLAQCKDEVDAYLTKDFFTSLKNRAKENGYIKSGTEEKLHYESELYSKGLALKRAEATLDGLKGFAADTGSIIYDEIISLNREIATLEQEIKILEEYIKSYSNTDKIKPKDFEDEIASVYANVEKFTADIEPVASYVYGKVTKINYLSTKVVEVEGGRGLIISAVIALVAGIVVAAIVAFAVGWSKQKKVKSTESVSGVPVYGEAQLQAAATDESKEEKDTKNDK
ncbi:MAG: hypothetical protein K2N23_05595 [Clostridia bacterium]|nr:hypothetical protein [Clostridia bacterium]